VIGDHASGKSHFMTDEAPAFTGIGWNFVSHGTVTHGENEYVRGHIHTNTVEGFFSILKRGVYGVYQHVSEAHLHRYLAEFDFRYSNREKLGVDDTARAARALERREGASPHLRNNSLSITQKGERYPRHRKKYWKPRDRRQLWLPFFKSRGEGD
jgi:ISXO2-like transposase domain